MEKLSRTGVGGLRCSSRRTVTMFAIHLDVASARRVRNREQVANVWRRAGKEMVNKLQAIGKALPRQELGSKSPPAYDACESSFWTAGGPWRAIGEPVRRTCEAMVNKLRAVGECKTVCACPPRGLHSPSVRQSLTKHSPNFRHASPPIQKAHPHNHMGVSRSLSHFAIPQNLMPPKRTHLKVPPCCNVDVLGAPWREPIRGAHMRCILDRTMPRKVHASPT
jgi:hypothetical protein